MIKFAIMMLPKDPYILLSLINMKLRDEYPDLDELCGSLGIERAQLESELAQAGFSYDKDTNQFK